MFGTTPYDLASTLSQMEKTARERSHFGQIAAKQLFKEYLAQDSRFSEFHPEALNNRVMEARSNGRTLDLDDPVLRGNEKRPLSW